MNLEERESVTNYGVKTSKKSTLKNNSEEFLSPTRRSSRIRKPKLSVDYCTIDEAIKTTTSTTNKNGPNKNSPKCTDISPTGKVKRSNRFKDNAVSAFHQDVEKNNSFSQVNDDVNGSFETIFDDIFGQTYTKTLQNLLPKKIHNASTKERKFFKRRSVESSVANVAINSYVDSKTKLPTEDVSKVFKIISKPTVLSDMRIDTKSHRKPSLKTYSNKRKCFQKRSSVVESFGLPDHPIVPDMIKPVPNNKLDTEILDASEITILDLQKIEEPWIITNIDGETLFPYYEEVRIKAEPDPFRVNSSFLDTISTENMEECDINFFTSTPLSQQKIVNNNINCSVTNTPKKITRALKNKEIDIEAIKVNFRKILNKKFELCNEELETVYSLKKKDKPGVSIRSTSVSGEIPFVESCSLIMDDKEIEISNDFPKLCTSRKDILSTDGASTSKRKLSYCNKKHHKAASISIETCHGNRSRRRKKIKCGTSDLSNSDQQLKVLEIMNGTDFHLMRRRSQINKKKSETVMTNNKKRCIPKKNNIETELKTINARCTRKPSSCRNNSVKLISTTACNEKLNINKQHSVLPLDNGQTVETLKPCNNHQINQMDISRKGNTEAISSSEDHLSHNIRKEELSLKKIGDKIGQAEALQKELKSNLNVDIISEFKLCETEKQFNKEGRGKKAKKAASSNLVATCKRVLRSANQDNATKDGAQKIIGNLRKQNIDIPKSKVYLETENSSVQKRKIVNVSANEDITARVKIDLEKCDASKLVTVKNQDEVFRIFDTLTEMPQNSRIHFAEDVKKKLSLTTGKKPVPELRIVITPLHVSQLLDKLPITINNTHNTADFMSPTKRRLRSFKAAMCHTEFVKNADHTLNPKRAIDSLLERFNAIDGSALQKDCKNEILSKSLPTDALMLKNGVSDVKSPIYIYSKKSYSLDSSRICHQTKIIKNRINDDTIYKKNNSINKNLCVNIEIFNSHLDDSVNATKTDSSNILIVPKEEIHNGVSERNENSSDELVNNATPEINHLLPQAQNVYDSICKEGASGEHQEQEKYSRVECDKLNSSIEMICHRDTSNDFKYFEKQEVLEEEEGIILTAISHDTLNNTNSSRDPSFGDLPSSEDLEVELLCKNSMFNSKLVSPTLFSQMVAERQLITSISEEASLSSESTVNERNEPVYKTETSNTQHINDTVLLVSDVEDKSKVQRDKTNSTQAEGINCDTRTDEIDSTNVSEQLSDSIESEEKTFSMEQAHLNGHLPETIHMLETQLYEQNYEVTTSVDSSKENVSVHFKTVYNNNTTNGANENIDLTRISNCDVANDNESVMNIDVMKIHSENCNENGFIDIKADGTKAQSNSTQLETISAASQLNIDKLNTHQIMKDVSAENNIINNNVDSVNTTIDALQLEGSNLENVDSVLTADSIDTLNDNIELRSYNLIQTNNTHIDINLEHLHSNQKGQNEVNETFENIHPTSSEHTNFHKKIDTEPDQSEKLYKNLKHKLHLKKDALSNINDVSNSVKIREKDIIKTLDSITRTQPNENTSEELSESMELKHQKYPRKNNINDSNTSANVDVEADLDNQALVGNVTQETFQNTEIDLLFQENIYHSPIREYYSTSNGTNVAPLTRIELTENEVTPNKISSSVAEKALRKEDKENEAEKVNANCKPVRLSRRKSLDNLDSLNGEKEKYNSRLRRSKSVAPRIIGSMKKTRASKLDQIVDERANQNDEEYRMKSPTQFTLDSSDKPYSQLNGYVRKNTGRARRGRRSLKGENINTAISDDSPDFQVGDLAWAQIGAHPFWPCLIIKDPETKCYKKIVHRKYQKILYHVRFFGDNGRRAWINKHQIMLYKSQNDLRMLFEQQRSEKKRSELQAYIVRTSKLQKWENAVKEAELLKTESLHSKLLFFARLFNSKIRNKKNSISNSNVSTNNESLKRKRKENDPEGNEKQLPAAVNDRSPSRKKLKKNTPDDSPNIAGRGSKEEIMGGFDFGNGNVSVGIEKGESYLEFNQNGNGTQNVNLLSSKSCPKNQDSSCQNENLISTRLRSKDQHDNSYKNEGDETKQSDHLLSPNLHKKIQSDSMLETDSKSNMDHAVNMLLYSMEEQKDLFKRNNLFKGISRDKVCQHCLKPGKVLKCRGRCNGTYHIDCATKIVVQSVSKKRKWKRTSKSNTAEETGDDSFCSENASKSDASEKNAEVKPLRVVNSEYNLRHAIRDKNRERSSANASNAEKVLSDHVQIITVPSCVYNTPPRKTFPPDFKNMTLAEQIDYKMKEIMRKFESKTVYSVSSVETNREEQAKKHPQLNNEYFSKREPLFPASSTANTEINLENVKKTQKEEFTVEKTVTTRIKFSEETSNDTLMSLENKGSVKKAGFAQKSFVRHVTADFDSESMSDVQENNTQENKLDISESSTETTAGVDPKSFRCGFCTTDLDPFCFICDQAISRRGSNIRQKCSLYQCGRFYHPECLKLWPQTQWSLIQTMKHKDSDEIVDSFVCPLHVCHTCVSDDPRAATSRCSGDKIVKCLRCPSTYHSTNLCVPAGTSILSSTQVLCPRHRERSKTCTINTTWCFLCSEGGNLICCETCPTSVHPECLPVNLTDDDKFICEDCESGRLPLYDEIVWVKLGKFRWWPAVILFPNEVPVNVMNIKHATGQFVVRFFGTYDYYWVSRGRSFLFQEGDTGQCNSIRKKVDAAFNRAVEEAVAAHKLKREFKQSQEAESLTSLKPPPYIRIKVNKPVGNVRQLDLDLSSTTACECDPSQAHPCGPDSDCLNRLLLTECNPDVCPAGERCKNQLFEKREYPPLVPYKTQGRGWGLKTLAPIKKGQFVVEYVGELIDMEEYQRRIQKMHEQKEENYYFLTIDKDRMLDAGPKGNVARFMNHCCQPNCETQKWTVNGDTRVGLFATEDIPVETELTFNYNLECVGKEKKVCKCGAPNCSGFIGVKAKQDTETKKPKRTMKKKTPLEPVIVHQCFVCGMKEKDVVPCNNKICNKAYHLKCLQMSEWPEGNKFICPWHNCNICSKRTIRCCVKCVSSFCPSHSEGNIRYDSILGFVCSNHDPTKISNEEPIKLRKKKSKTVTDETAVTSTTSDDVEDEDDTPLLLRSNRYKKSQEFLMESGSEIECYDGKCSRSASDTIQISCSNYDSPDEGTVSSATLTDFEDGCSDRRKRKRTQKVRQSKKKNKTSKLVTQCNTANSVVKDDSLRNVSTSELSSRCNELVNR